MRLIKIFLLTPIVKLSCTWLQRAMRFSRYGARLEILPANVEVSVEMRQILVDFSYLFHNLTHNNDKQRNSYTRFSHALKDRYDSMLFH